MTLIKRNISSGPSSSSPFWGGWAYRCSKAKEKRLITTTTAITELTRYLIRQGPASLCLWYPFNGPNPFLVLYREFDPIRFCLTQAIPSPIFLSPDQLMRLLFQCFRQPFHGRGKRILGIILLFLCILEAHR